MTRATSTLANNKPRIAEIPAGHRGGLIGITFAPGKQQTDGMMRTHRRDLAADLDCVAAWNAAVVVTLIEGHELAALGIMKLGEEVRLRHMEWHNWPIQDGLVPDEIFVEAWPARSAMLRDMLARGGRVLIHCKDGLGRAGMVGARLLVEAGLGAGDAIRLVRDVRPGAIETEDQEAWVLAGRSSALPLPARRKGDVRDRAVGAMLGLAVGDALGAFIEFIAKPRFAVLGDMKAGGPHHLRRGQWTDDTAMALALADSLMLDPALNAHDLMCRFLDWKDKGSYSCTGTCFDVGNATSAALERFRRDGNPLAGSADAMASGNGALMRLAPVAVRHWSNTAEMQRVAEMQTRTTHGSPATLAAASTFSMLLAEAIGGGSLPAVLASESAEAIPGGWRGLHRDRIEGTGFVDRSLQAAVWAVSRTTNFRSAVLLAANLGDDADTTAAIAGQLAGAIYGISGIPREWLDVLAWRQRLEAVSEVLFEAGWVVHEAARCDRVGLGQGFAAPSLSADWTLRERLAALAAYRPVFAQSGDMPSEHIDRFSQMVYEYGWVRVLNWSDWYDSPRGKALHEDPLAMAEAHDDELAAVITATMRGDRFSEGHLAGMISNGTMLRVAMRAESLLALLPKPFER